MIPVMDPERPPACRWCGQELPAGRGPVCEPCAIAFRIELVYSAADRADAEAIAGALLVTLGGPTT